MYELSTLGFAPFFAEQIAPEDLSSLTLARVMTEHRGAWEVAGPSGAWRATLAGHLREDEDETHFPGVGDWVLLRGSPLAGAQAVIERVLRRRTVFTRGAAGKRTRAQVIAANIDAVFIVCGLDDDFSVSRIERYLARIGASGAEPVLVLNKSDVCLDLQRCLAEVAERCPSVVTHVISARGRDGLEPLRSHLLPGKTIAFVGSSGAGKSTLINALLGEARLLTGEVNERDGQGRHTTTHRHLLVLDGGGLLMDTPGMRELALLDEEGLEGVFGDIQLLAEECRYRDCRHESEPGCAVLAALGSGRLRAHRLESFRKLQREAAANELRQDEHRRRKAERVWGQLSREVARLRQWKGGKD